MATKEISKNVKILSTAFDDFFRPWNDWFTNGGQVDRMLTLPAVNVAENDNKFSVSLAAPGLSKNDFEIEVNGNMITISCEKQDKKVEKNKEFTREEFNYSSFSRTFTLPEDIDQENIDADYIDGVLNVSLPKKGLAKKMIVKKITVK